MSAFLSALWAEALKALRSKISLATTAALLLLPLVGGLFMVILKNPEQARSMGLIGAKAQIVAGTADWPTYFSVLLQGAAIAGAMLFSFITAWVFGREFSDRTAKELLALPTPRGFIVGAKFILLAVWLLGLTLMMAFIGLAIGWAVDIPGWSPSLAWSSFETLLLVMFLNFLLMPIVALLASAGRGYLAPLGWAFLTMALAQIAVVLGWGDWFPWAAPALASGMAGPRADAMEAHSYVMILVAFIAGLAATFAWWQSADQTR